jgi:hypothetical protein
MRKSSWASAVVLAVSVLCAAPVQASAAQGLSDAVGRGTARVPAGVTSSECVQGGGIIMADSAAPNGFSMRCQGGTHDGETIG